MIGPKWLESSGFDGDHPEDVIKKFGDDRFVFISSQMIEPRELKF